MRLVENNKVIRGGNGNLYAEIFARIPIDEDGDRDEDYTPALWRSPPNLVILHILIIFLIKKIKKIQPNPITLSY